MVDRSNLQHVNMLYGETRAIEAALQGFANGGRIVEMGVSPGPLPEPGEGMPMMPRMSGMPVDVSMIEYPAQMVESIKQSLHQRLDAINAQLQQLGLTGEAAPAAAAAAQRRK